MSLGKAWPCLAALQRAYNHCPRTLRTNNPEKAPQGLSLPSLTSLELPQGSKRLQVKMSKGPGLVTPLGHSKFPILRVSSRSLHPAFIKCSYPQRIKRADASKQSRSGQVARAIGFSKIFICPWPVPSPGWHGISKMTLY